MAVVSGEAPLKNSGGYVWGGAIIEITYTAGNGAITINQIRGKAANSQGGPYNYNSITHTLTYPGGTGTITTRNATFNSTSWQTWTLDGTTTFYGSGSGAFKFTLSSSFPTIPGYVYDFGTIDIGTPTYTPSVTAPSVSASRTSVSYSFSVTDSGGAAITSSGVDLSLTSFGNVVASGSGTSNTINGLTPNTTYYARSFAFNGSYTGYSSTYPSFRTTGNPPVITSVSEAPTLDSCTLTINVTYDTNATWAAGLVEYGTTQSYGSSTPSNIIQGLNSGTTYYYRVTITDTEGRSGTYTSSFTTLSDSKVFYSSAGGSFVKRKLYISINGDAYKLVQGNKINII